MAFIQEPPRQTEVIDDCDVVVLGGGPAGLAAAAAAARGGARTLLVERYGFLGGMATAAGVTNFCGLHASVHGTHRQVVHGIADELLARIDRLGGLNAPHNVLGRIQAQAYDIPAAKRAADALLADAGARVLFHALAAGVAMGTAGRIDALLVETRAGRGAIRARQFIDASGDGDLAAWSGAPCERAGRDGPMLFPTMMYRINGVDSAAAGEIWREIPRLMAEAEAAGRFRFPRHGAVVRAQKHPQEWRVNITQLRTPDGRAVDGLDPAELSAAETEGRRQAFETVEFLRTLPGFADAYIVDIGPQLGIRETRRLAGAYMLTEDDVLGCASFPDSIGVNGWPVEEHVAGQVAYRWQPRESRGFNQLPYRMLLPRGVDNLLVAGRCAAMTHGGQSAARVSGPCFVMGQAAGTAAALALAGGIAPRALDISALQSRLAASGVWLGTEPEETP